jgi:hypothetical protein
MKMAIMQIRLNQKIQFRKINNPTQDKISSCIRNKIKTSGTCRKQNRKTCLLSTLAGFVTFFKSNPLSPLTLRIKGGGGLPTAYRAVGTHKNQNHKGGYATWLTEEYLTQGAMAH